VTVGRFGQKQFWLSLCLLASRGIVAPPSHATRTWLDRKQYEWNQYEWNQYEWNQYKWNQYEWNQSEYNQRHQIHVSKNKRGLSCGHLQMASLVQLLSQPVVYPKQCQQWRAWHKEASLFVSNWIRSNCLDFIVGCRGAAVTRPEVAVR
jgi:hypothetical protein